MLLRCRRLSEVLVPCPLALQPPGGNTLHLIAYLRGSRRSEHELKTKLPDLDISDRTLRHYEQTASDFREGTRDHDVSQNIGALLRHIEGNAPFKILDLGCGPGRDLKAFAALGHVPIGLDGASSFVEMARRETGCEVWHQDFLQLDLPLRFRWGLCERVTAARSVSPAAACTWRIACITEAARRAVQFDSARCE